MSQICIFHVTDRWGDFTHFCIIQQSRVGHISVYVVKAHLSLYTVFTWIFFAKFHHILRQHKTKADAATGQEGSQIEPRFTLGGFVSKLQAFKVFIWKSRRRASRPKPENRNGSPAVWFCWHLPEFFDKNQQQTQTFLDFSQMSLDPEEAGLPTTDLIFGFLVIDLGECKQWWGGSRSTIRDPDLDPILSGSDRI